ncbi:MAG: M48 family metallopeptidase [bacterium]
MQYTLIRSKNRKSSAALQVSPKGEIIVQAPWYMPKFVLDKFVDEHERWINKRLVEITKSVAKKEQHFATELDLEAFIITKTEEYEEIMGLKSSGLVFKRVTTYWGSCSPTGKISFNTEMIYAPVSAVEYVVVHELAHLKYRGHGVRFWDLVNKHFPRTAEMRKILRQVGHRR